MNREITMSLKKLATIVGSFSSLFVAIAVFLNTLYTDVQMVKYQVHEQTNELINVSGQMAEVSRDMTQLLHTMDKRLTLIEESAKQ